MEIIIALSGKGENERMVFLKPKTMSVYVDRAKHPYGRMLMCHMMADSLEELHAMADRIGVKRRWFQNINIPHYDICQSKKQLALAAGAVEIGHREMGQLIHKAKAGSKP